MDTLLEILVYVVLEFIWHFIMPLIGGLFVPERNRSDQAGCGCLVTIAVIGVIAVLLNTLSG